jgi:hypothetical protein
MFVSSTVCFGCAVKKIDRLRDTEKSILGEKFSSPFVLRIEHDTVGYTESQ